MKTTQRDAILAHLQKGRTIESVTALFLCKCWTLPQRIKELRDLGHDIRTEMVMGAGGRRHAVYSLVQPDSDAAE